MYMIEYGKAIVFGIIEGITEWLPISSTGHMILLDEFVKLRISADAAMNTEFYSMFEAVIQLGAILAVVVMYFKKLNPFSLSGNREERSATWRLWLRVVVAVLPSAVLGLLLDDWLDAHLYNAVTVSVMLILYGIAFLFIEKLNLRKRYDLSGESVEGMELKTAFLIGLFQCLALIPGTSRSGATILGAMLLGLSRVTAAEFSFFLAIPTMAGAGILRSLKFVKFLSESEVSMPTNGIVVLLLASAVAFAVSFFAIRFLTDFVKRHSFAPFGVYRIVLGVLVLLWFLPKLVAI